MRRLAWIFGQGSTRSIVTAEHLLAPNSWEMDPTTGAPRLLADNSDWDTEGPLAPGCLDPTNCTNANDIHWSGVHAFFYGEAWQAPYVYPPYASWLPAPAWAPITGLTGTPSGYAGSTFSPTDPRSARLYQAMGAKDIAGRLSIQYWDGDGTNPNGRIFMGPDVKTGGRIYDGDFILGKDIASTASDFWLAVNQETIRYYVQRGVDGFWQDNSSGWGDFGAYPTQDGFGDWSVSAFTTYAGLPPTFDIRQYLIARFQALFPGNDPTIATDPHWADPIWLGDPYWSKYKAFKAGETHRHAVRLKEVTVSETAAAGKDPDSVLMMGNDPPVVWGAAYTGDELDMANYEYSVGWSQDVGSQMGHGVPPYGRAGGSYALATRVGRSRHAAVIYYLNDKPGTEEKAAGISYTALQQHPNLGLVCGYEALTGNVLLNGNSQSRSQVWVGTDASTKQVHDTIARMAPILGNRVRTGQIAVLYSPETAESMLAPGFWAGFDADHYDPAHPSYLDHNLGYYGWTAALEELHFPYRAIPSFRLTLGELAGVALLVLPNVRAFEQSAISGVLLPFLSGGGRIIVTGADSGVTHTQVGNYLPNTGPLLVQQLAGHPGVEYTPANPGFDYHMGRLNPTGALRVNARNLIAQLVPVRELTLMPADPFVVAVTHEDLMDQRWFVDLANLDIDNTTDTIHGKGSFVLTWVLPPDFPFGGPPRAMFYDAAGTVMSLPVRLLGGRTIQVTTPGFLNWATIAITPH